MKATLVLAILACAYAAWVPSGSTARLKGGQTGTPRESRVPVGGAELYAREIGKDTFSHRPPRRARFRSQLSPAGTRPPLRCVPSHRLRPAGTWLFGSSSYIASSLSGIQKLDRRYSGSRSIGFNGVRADDEPRRELF